MCVITKCLLDSLFTLKAISVTLLVTRFVLRVFAKQRIDMFLVVEEHNPSEWPPCFSSESLSTSGCVSRHNEALCSSIMACSS